jgi:branched-chain amino acid transport system substrate-binding protein
VLRSEFLGTLGATTVAQVFPQITPSISIAVCAPVTGPAKPLGDRLIAGVQGAVEYSNELAGSLSRTYAVRQYDDQNTIAGAGVAASFASGDSTVIAVIGHINADATLQAIKTYGPTGVPLIVPASTDDRITATQYRNIFRLPTKDSFEGQIFARTVNTQYKPKLPYVFVQNADYGADVANGFLKEMESAKVPAQFQQFTYDNADFGAIVDKAMLAQFDYAFLAGFVGDMGPIVGTLRAKGYTGPIGASQGFFDPASLKLGPAADGMIVSTSMPFLPLAPSTVRWRQEFETHHGTMDPLAAFGYAAAQLVIAAVTRTNAAGRGATVTALAQGIPIDTMTGTYSFTVFGDPLQPELYYYTLRDGKFTYLKQARPSTFMAK